MKSTVAFLLAFVSGSSLIQTAPSDYHLEFPASSFQQYFTIDPNDASCTGGMCRLSVQPGTNQILAAVDSEDITAAHLSPYLKTSETPAAYGYSGVNLIVKEGEIGNIMGIVTEANLKGKIALTIHYADYTKLNKDVEWEGTLEENIVQVWVILTANEINDAFFDAPAIDNTTWIVNDDLKANLENVKTKDHKLVTRENNEILLDTSFAENPQCNSRVAAEL
ncbi:hypothetical protein DSO57_1000388 [Entomophthora muscae]|uniref:Uncharacterized protein n=1 Tax=Entomophthora muscae TaxID=34485 RepID=A0ACC2UK82_9FUNG|nr:hypothetical protein DSO57_1000388 [Entomophthora muscae]